jgi:hypothetical protein
VPRADDEHTAGAPPGAQTVKEPGSGDTATTLRVRRLEQLIRSAEGVGLVATARHDPPPFRSLGG